MMKALFVLMTLTLGCEAQAQETCETEAEQPIAAYVYVDLDGSGKLEEILLSSTSDGDVTIAVAFDVPEKRADEYTSDPDLGLEIKDVDGDKVDDLSLVVQGKTVGLVEVDWASLAKDACGKGDYESDAQVVYRQKDGDEIQVGPVSCKYVCVSGHVEGTWKTGYTWVCDRGYWDCEYVGYGAF
jgi:hypothetical protein